MSKRLQEIEKSLGSLKDDIEDSTTWYEASDRCVENFRYLISRVKKLEEALMKIENQPEHPNYFIRHALSICYEALNENGEQE